MRPSPYVNAEMKAGMGGRAWPQESPGACESLVTIMNHGNAAEAKSLARTTQAVGTTEVSDMTSWTSRHEQLWWWRISSPLKPGGHPQHQSHNRNIHPL
jgi:hypothetical protein